MEEIDFCIDLLEVSGHDLGPMWLVILVFFKLFFFKASIGTLRCWAGGGYAKRKEFIVRIL